MFKFLVLTLAIGSFLPTAAAEPGSKTAQSKAKPALAKPAVGRPAEVAPGIVKAGIVKPVFTTAVGKPSFGFHGSLARVTRPAPRVVLPRGTNPRTAEFEGFGGALCKPPCRVVLSRPAPALARKTAATETADSAEDDASTERVVSEVFYPCETAPRMPVDGYNPINPSNAPYKKTYRVDYTPNDGGCSSCSSRPSCDTTCTSCCAPRATSCEPCTQPRRVRRVYYRPVVYARPCGYGCGWGRGWGWGGGYRAGWGWGGGWGPYW